VPPRVLIWGAAGHARVVADIIRLGGRYELAGFLDDVRPERAGEEFEGATIVGGRDRLPRLLEAGVHDLIVAFGDCRARVDAARFAASLGFSLATAIHPSAVVAGSARLGGGTIVAANAVVNPGTHVGENVIVNTRSSIDHDCVVEDGAHICPGVTLAARVRVGELAWIGVGATVSDGRSIGKRTLIGAGAVVVRDIPDDVVAYGVPARVMRKNP